jgi:hypothetical protein
LGGSRGSGRKQEGGSHLGKRVVPHAFAALHIDRTTAIHVQFIEGIPKNTNKRSRRVAMTDHATLQNGPDDGEKGCSLQQITMFDCDKESMETKGIVKCYPIPRVFRVYVSGFTRSCLLVKALTIQYKSCRNRPAVEVTALLQYKDASGDPVLPKDYLYEAITFTILQRLTPSCRSRLPKGESWKPVGS